MAIFYCQFSAIKRSEGRAATSCAAYRTSSKITDQLTGEIYDYRRKSGVVDHDRFGWSGSTQDLWNSAELAEINKDGSLKKRAIVAREIIIALPHELTYAQRRKLVRRYAKYIQKKFGVAVEYAIHRPDREGDQRNHHAHIMFTSRVVENDQLKKKRASLMTVELDDLNFCGCVKNGKT